MFDERTSKQTFFSAPQSVTSLVAALLEPGVTAVILIASHLWFGEPFRRPAFVLCLLVFLLSFPGRNRFRERLIAAASDIAMSWLLQLILLWICAYVTQSFEYFEIDVLLTWAIVTPVAQVAAVWVGRSILRRQSSRAKSRRAIVIVGGGRLGLKVGHALTRGRDSNVELLGYFDDRRDDRVEPEVRAKWLGTLADLAAFILERGVREVYITLPLGTQPRIIELLERIQGTTASLFFVPDVFGVSIIQGRLRDMNGIAVVGICETPFTGTNELAKRVSDIVLALAILIAAIPVFLTVAVLVKASSPGPVLFRQRRNGLDGSEIVVWKFRSMTVQEDSDRIPQARRQDPRITPIGAFLRRTSLDELPQFINVLQGRMSVVGPRPHAVSHNEAYRQIIKGYMVRHKVKPGITGWAQVNGLRGETDTVDKMRARVEYDLEYLRNWNLALDLQIIARTVLLVVHDRNAF